MEQYNLFDIIDKNLQEKEQTMGKFEGRLRVFEAFAGVGSQRMALRNLNIDHEVVGIAEIDKHALKSYEARHGDCPNYGDISKIDPHELPDMDLFTYSFPCQDLSNAGRMAGLKNGTRSGLLYECEKIIEAKKPKYLLLENVKNLVSKRFKNDFLKWLEYLEGLGYKSYWKVINAKYHGLPQNRERVFAISILGGGSYNFPQDKELCADLKEIIINDAPKEYYKDIKFEGSDKVLKIPQNGPKGYIELPLPGICDLSYPNSKTRRGRVQGGGKVCPTVMARPQDIMYIDENKAVRRLTSIEYWRLMGFKDSDFYKAQAVCSPAQLDKQAGNSIAVNVLEGIFKNLFL